MSVPEFTTTTGKTVNVDRVKFHLCLARDDPRGAYRIVFDDDTDLFLTGAENREILDAHRAWWKAGGYGS
jgi:hypothetical protein